MFLLWLRQLLRCGDRTTASVPLPAEGRSSPTNTPVSCVLPSFVSNTLVTWCEELTHLKSPWCWGKLKAGAEGDNKRWDSWMASPTQWTWVWVNSRSWWGTGRPCVLSPWGRTCWLNWTDTFFSTGQVLLSAPSWCSSSPSGSEGVFLVCLWREM